MVEKKPKQEITKIKRIITINENKLNIHFINSSNLINFILKYMQRDEINRLFEKNYKRIYILALKMLKNIEDAEDATQEIFMKTYQSINQFKKKAKFSTWLYRIALNHIYYVKKMKKRQYNYSPHEMKTVSNNDPEKVLKEKELFKTLENIIENLSGKQKEVFLMRYYGQLKFKEIAKILKKSMGTVKSNYFFAMEKIKKELNKNSLLFIKD